MILSFAASAAGVASTSTMTEPWQLILLWGCVVGLSTRIYRRLSAAFIAARWFRTHEGLVVGVLTSATPPVSSSFCRRWAALVYAWRLAADVAGPGRLDVVLLAAAGAIHARPAGGSRHHTAYGTEGRPRPRAAPQGNPSQWPVMPSAQA